MNASQTTNFATASKLQVRKGFVRFNSAAPIPHAKEGYLTKRCMREAFKDLATSIGMDLAKVIAEPRQRLLLISLCPDFHYVWRKILHLDFWDSGNDRR